MICTLANSNDLYGYIYDYNIARIKYGLLIELMHKCIMDINSLNELLYSQQCNINYN